VKVEAKIMIKNQQNDRLEKNQGKQLPISKNSFSVDFNPIAESYF
jgi:hypothetical protein